MKDQTFSAKIDPATGLPFPASVEYRGKGQYRARKRLTGGERIHQTFSTAKLARRCLDTTATKLELGRVQDTRPLERQTVHALVDRYVRKEMQTRDNDRKGHIPSILQDEIAQLPLVDLPPTAVRGFQVRLAEKYSAATVVKQFNLLAAICHHAIAEWDLPFSKNPATATAVKRPADAQTRSATVVYIGDEYDPLLEAIATSPWPDDVTFVQFVIEQGTRWEEALTLLWRDIDFDRHTLSLGKMKTMHRTIERGPEIRPLTPGAARLLRFLQAQRKSARPGDLVFDIGSKDAFSVRLGRMTKKAGLKDLTFHDLRHEATSRLARIYTNPRELRRVTGHREIKSLDRYYQRLCCKVCTSIGNRFWFWLGAVVMNDFKGRHFRGEVILWIVRWYCRYGISYRNLETMLCERSASINPSTFTAEFSAMRPKWKNVYAGIGSVPAFRAACVLMRLTSKRKACGLICIGPSTRTVIRLISTSHPPGTPKLPNAFWAKP